MVNIQYRLLLFITRSNWVLFASATIFGFAVLPLEFARGILFGGLIVTINFHLLSSTLKKALTPPVVSSGNVILAKYYLRFLASGFIIFILISNHYVNPIGLFVGLSVVVASITLATVCEIKKLIFKEAV